jgi:hypothetical protein
LIASSAPIFRQKAHFSSLPAVATTRAPNACASWIAVVPMPLVPPWTRIVSPFCSRPRWKTFVQTVKNVSGSAAPSRRPSPPGIGRHCGAGAVQSSA